MDEQKFEKTLKDVKGVSIIAIVFVLIAFFVILSSGSLTVLALASLLVRMALCIGTIIGCNNRMIYGPVCGVVVSILMILTFDIIVAIIGIIYLIECINVIRYMKN